METPALAVDTPARGMTSLTVYMKQCVLVPCTAGPGLYKIVRAGPEPTFCGAGPGLKNIKHTGLGSGLGLVWPGRAWAGPGPNKNVNTKPRFFILILIKTDYKLYFRLMNV